MTELGAVGLGVVVGWLLPIVRSRTWPSIGASLAAVAIVGGTAFALAGLPAAVAAGIGAVSGGVLHVAFLKYLARHAPRTQEG